MSFFSEMPIFTYSSPPPFSPYAFRHFRFFATTGLPDFHASL